MKKQIIIRVDEDQKDILEYHAKEEKRTKQDFILSAVEHYINSKDYTMQDTVDDINRRLSYIDKNQEVILEVLNHISVQLQDKNVVNPMFVSTALKEHEIIEEAKRAVNERLEKARYENSY